MRIVMSKSDGGYMAGVGGLGGEGGVERLAKVGSEQGVQCSENAVLAKEAGSDMFERGLLPPEC